LAQKINCNFTSSISDIVQNADLYFVVINDDEIQNIIKHQIFENKFLVHCAGSIDIEVFKPVTNRYAVLYPVQTFSKKMFINFKNIPICIEANNAENLDIISKIANKLSDEVLVLNSLQRKYLHLSAVFANNFINYFLSVSKQILNENEMDFELLKPLIYKTIDNIFLQKNQNILTGPAIRGDIKIIKQHLEMLKNYPNYEKLYRFVSKNINENLDIEL
jgi:predicted short-subunit dehydrogenase-like oxidoreductase (DUF2520 family)